MGSLKFLYLRKASNVQCVNDVEFFIENNQELTSS